MALVDLIRKRDARVAIATFASPATELSQGSNLVAGVAAVAVAGERIPRTQSVAPMSESEEVALFEWLRKIEETNQTVINKVLQDCEHDIETRTFFLNLAAEVPDS